MKLTPEVDRAVRAPHGSRRRGADPLRAADAPGAVADLGDLEAGSAEGAVVHQTLDCPGPGAHERDRRPEARLLSERGDAPARLHGVAWLADAAR